MKKLKTIFLLVFLASYSTSLYAQIGEWQVHQGEGVISLETKTDAQRTEALTFGKSKIPDAKHTNWAPIKVDASGQVNYSAPSAIKSCATQADYTFFQNVVDLSDISSISSFKVSVDLADDGVRIYLFNSKNKDGYFDSNADITRAIHKNKSVELKDKLVEGINRIVIVHFDQCAPGNTVRGIRADVVVNKPVLPKKFKLHAYSIHGNRQSSGSDYWMGLKNGSTQAKIIKPNEGTILEFEKEIINEAQGIVAFKLTNSSLKDSYLFVNKDKNVEVGPINSTQKTHQFITRTPEETESGSLQFASFESVAFPKWFLRHESYDMKISEGNNVNRQNKVYRQDASWLIQ